MYEEKSFEVVIGGKSITLATGKLAGQAGGAVTVRQGDSIVLATATMSKKPREGLGFFPLTVDYEERLYAGGRIPGSFFRREGRPTEGAILTDRMTDRTIRPLFPKDMLNEVQIILYALSSDGETPLDVLGILGASAALTISDVPFAGPIGAVRVAQQDGNFVINPTYPIMDESALDLVIAGTSDTIMMVECGAKEIDEAEIVKAFETGQEAIKLATELQVQMQAEVGKSKRSYPSFQLNEEVQIKVAEWLEGRVQELISTPKKKAEHSESMNALRDEAIEAFAGEEEWDDADIRKAFEKVHKAVVRSYIVDTKTRTDGRGPTDIREINAEVDFSPRAHGSGLFTRGETQVLTLATVGTPRERQELDGLSPRNEKRYMHHYNFPPFSVGETKFLRGASRREIGHGALAERALLPVIPPQDEFPYTMRLVSEVLASNGSSSMASVCGSTLALMDTGVPIREPVAGIAMGLIKEGDQSVILTDILGMEDHLGDMDFKVAGTTKGITALQMDIKIAGITSELMSEALAQARVARLFILEKIKATIMAPREELKPHVPRMTIVKVDPEKIGAIIGPGGKMIRNIQETTGTRVDIEDDGTVFISAADGDSSKAAKEMIEGLVEEAVLGRIYTGKVVRTTDFGAFVEILPGTDGLVHISQLDSEHTERVEDVAKLGEEITVMVTNVGHDGKIRLSRKAVLEGWTLEEAIENDRPPSGRRPNKGGDRRRGGGSSKYRGNKN